MSGGALCSPESGAATVREFTLSAACPRGAAAHRVPQRQLPLAHAAEAGGQQVAVGQEDDSGGPRALVGLLLLLHSASHNTASR